MKTKAEKREEALERQEGFKKLSPKQKLLKLDLIYGDGKGAIKERKKLQYEIEHTGGIPDSTGSGNTPKEKKKHYQKPKKS